MPIILYMLVWAKSDGVLWFPVLCPSHGLWSPAHGAEEPVSSWATCSKSPYSFIPTKLGGSKLGPRCIGRACVVAKVEECGEKRWEKPCLMYRRSQMCEGREVRLYVCWYFSTQHQPCTENSLWKPNGFQDTGTRLDAGANFHSLSIQEFDAHLPHPALLDSCPKMVFSGWWGYRTVGSQRSFWISYDFVDTNANHAEQDSDNNAKTELAVFNMKYRGIGVGHYSLVRHELSSFETIAVIFEWDAAQHSESSGTIRSEMHLCVLSIWVLG